MSNFIAQELLIDDEEVLSKYLRTARLEIQKCSASVPRTQRLLEKMDPRLRLLKRADLDKSFIVTSEREDILLMTIPRSKGDPIGIKGTVVVLCEITDPCVKRLAADIFTDLRSFLSEAN